MPVQHRQRGGEVQQPVALEESSLGQGRVEGGRAVALAQDEPITPRIAGVRGIDAQHLAEEHGQDVGGREIAAGMAEARAVHHLQPGAADGAREAGERGNVRGGVAVRCRRLHIYAR